MRHIDLDLSENCWAGLLSHSFVILAPFSLCVFIFSHIYAHAHTRTACSPLLSTCSCDAGVPGSDVCVSAGPSSCCLPWWSGFGWRWLTRGTGAVSRWTAMTCGRRPGSCCRELTASLASWSKCTEWMQISGCCVQGVSLSWGAAGRHGLCCFVSLSWGGTGMLRLSLDVLQNQFLVFARIRG